MVFRERKVPKHLIIQDEYEIRQRQRFGKVRILVILTLVVSVTYIVSVGVAQL